MAEENASEDAGDGTIRIVLADDHAVVRSALCMLLEAEPDFEVVAQAGDAENAERKVSGHHPDVLVLDLTMPGGSGLGAIEPIRAKSPDTRVVVLTMHGEPAFVREAMRAGASAYVLKDAADTELVKAVRLAAEDQTYLQPELGARLASQPADEPGELTDREIEVLKLIALGHTNAEIAEQLYLSVRTVESHRAHIQHKLNLTTRSELVRFALERDLIEL